mgnify:CR=1 FL=1
MKKYINNKLIDYLDKNYSDVRVIGVFNPSIIITYNEKTYVIYLGGEKRFVLCYKEERYFFNKPEELKKIIK